jgi:hypothetical protein
MNRLMNKERATYTGYQGLDTHLNSLFFPKIIKSKGNLIQIQPQPSINCFHIGHIRKFWIEKDLVYPFAPDLNVVKAHLYWPEIPLAAIIPNRGNSVETIQEATQQLKQLPRLSAYFKAYRHDLEQQAAIAPHRPANLPYWAVNCPNPEIFSERKVAWASSGHTVHTIQLNASTIFKSFALKNLTIIPGKDLTYCSFSDTCSQLYFLSCVEHSTRSQKIKAFLATIPSSDLSVSLPIEKFDKQNDEHFKLAFKVSSTYFYPFISPSENG